MEHVLSASAARRAEGPAGEAGARQWSVLVEHFNIIFLLAPPRHTFEAPYCIVGRSDPWVSAQQVLHARNSLLVRSKLPTSTKYLCLTQIPAHSQRYCGANHGSWGPR